MYDWVFDQRWCAPHGIGRFAYELRCRLKGFRDLTLAGSPTAPWDPWRLRVHLRRCRADGYFSPGFNVPAWVRMPVITTIHDLIHIHFERECSRAKRAYYRLVQRPVVRDSPVTLTVSEFSRQQIIQWYEVPDSSVVCVGNGVSAEFTPHGEAHHAETPYVLYVGNSKPHKNLPTLIKAMSILVNQHDIDLVLVCRPDSMLRSEIQQHHFESRTTVVSGLSDLELARYYRGAMATVLPSHYEGFGLPLVEAMACGCPVIGADRTSIPEVIGEAGLLFDPNDAEQLSECLSQLVQTPELREQLRQRGFERSAQFTWDRVAEKARTALRPFMNV